MWSVHEQWIVTSPIVLTGGSSKSGVQDVPWFSVFQRPPVPVPTPPRDRFELAAEFDRFLNGVPVESASVAWFRSLVRKVHRPDKRLTILARPPGGVRTSTAPILPLRLGGQGKAQA